MATMPTPLTPSFRPPFNPHQMYDPALSWGWPFPYSNLYSKSAPVQRVWTCLDLGPATIENYWVLPGAIQDPIVPIRWALICWGALPRNLNIQKG